MKLVGSLLLALGICYLAGAFFLCWYSNSPSEFILFNLRSFWSGLISSVAGVTVLIVAALRRSLEKNHQ